jgi:predicted dehydrogenase
MKIGIVGLGYWGPNLVRNFLGTEGVSNVIACDTRSERLQSIKQKFPSLAVTNDYNSLLTGDADAIVIATPVDLHYALAKQALYAGKHIWVEKPFTASAVHGQELIDIADHKKLKIFVDHTFIYTGAVKKIKTLVDQDELGDINYFDSVRINLGLFQTDVNVVWDLAPHDFAIMNYIIPNKRILAISANGIANYYDHENIAHVSVYFEENCFAHFHLNWTSPVKIRRTIIGGIKKMLLYDDMENSEKIKVYDSRIEINTEEGRHDALAQYRIGDMYSPKVGQVEALALAAKEFVSCIHEDRNPLTSGGDGLRVVQLLEAAELSIKNRGRVVEL